MSAIYTQHLGPAIGLDGSQAINIEFSQQEFQADSQVAGPRAGWVITDFSTYDSGQSIALQPGGKILVAGYSANEYEQDGFALARYNADGSLDISFSEDGRLTTDIGFLFAYSKGLALQAAGKIVVVGGSDGKFAMARYNPDGSLDTSFSGDGKLTTSIGSLDGSFDIICNSLALQSDGKEGAHGCATTPW